MGVIIMNRIIYMLLFSSLILTGCYQGDDKSTVRINLGNLNAINRVQNKSFIDKILMIFTKEAYAQTAPADLLKIHVGVYNGKILIEKLSLSLSEIPSSKIIEVEVPAGDNRTILVIGENILNQAGYYGYSNTDLVPGVTAAVTIALQAAFWEPLFSPDPAYPRSFAIDNSVSPVRFLWTGSGVRTRYYVEEDFTGNVIYSGYGFETEYSGGEYSFNLYVEFEDFNLKTAPFNLNFG
ncbi:MAG: hypothetical protein CVV49_09870 [Spirochaetae bacterium HGW-Spirochaetae-5]|nr:MAG: hypothetical protein CVV49_09870 [Spirochaetae bacterium HGW-Spirochaetae-5]